MDQDLGSDQQVWQNGSNALNTRPVMSEGVTAVRQRQYEDVNTGGTGPTDGRESLDIPLQVLCVPEEAQRSLNDGVNSQPIPAARDEGVRRSSPGRAPDRLDL
ncbi:hypothetical protein ABEB36_012638 [Hypothenemus hampei]|uniref:Uncharacterized protein n=1 Tax=Hypothenemus hampei TaxID=57062 RepID=A0ABD1EC06_HYPHA